jgi:putative transposase
MFNSLLQPLSRLVKRGLQFIQQHVAQWTTPATGEPLVGTLSDGLRTKSEFIVENALLRQQLMVLERQVKWPKFSRWDRLVLAGQ